MAWVESGKGIHLLYLHSSDVRLFWNNHDFYLVLIREIDAECRSCKRKN